MCPTFNTPENEHADPKKIRNCYLSELMASYASSFNRVGVFSRGNRFFPIFFLLQT